MLSPRTLLTLGRAGNLPTVWSNCLAGWWLGGGGRTDTLAPLLSGATLLYLGGASLNDAMDAAHDRQYRRTRPIPSNEISAKAAGLWGTAWMVLGVLILFKLGLTAGLLGLALIVCLLAYNTLHRPVPLSPGLLGACRLLLYLVGASAAAGVSGWAVWCGLAMAAYISGVGCFRRWERSTWSLHYWPVTLLAAPVILALLMNGGSYRGDAMLLSLVLGLWTLRSIRHTFWGLERSQAKTVSGLQAGIVLVDLLAVADSPRPLGAVFLALFLLGLGLQRLLPER